VSEKALKAKGIWNYLKNINPKKLKPRIVYGFLKKRSKGKVKYFSSRWFFLISSRPLVTLSLIPPQNSEAFLEDPENLSETVLPPLLEFDVIYYFAMD